MLTISIVIFLILLPAELKAKCVNHLIKERMDGTFLDIMSYEGAQMRTVGVTTTCTNVSLPLEGFVEHFCENCTREIKIYMSNIPTLPRTAFDGIRDVNILRLQGTNTSYVEPGTFSQMNKLRELYFTNNNIKKISENIFNSLHELKVLDLSQNNLIEIDPNFINGNLNLMHLNLSSNQLPLLNFTELLTIKLTSIDLRNNTVSTINFGNISANFAYLSHNKLKRIEGCNLNVHDLDISYNNMSTLPVLDEKCLRHQFEVRALILSHNALTQLEEEFFQAFSKLTSLDVSNNMIQHLPISIFRYLATLYVFDISHNNLTELDVSIFDIGSNLNYVNMSYNQINILKANIDGNRHAKDLDLCMQYNPIKAGMVTRLINLLPPGTKLHIDISRKSFTWRNLKEIVETANKSSVKIIDNSSSENEVVPVEKDAIIENGEDGDLSRILNEIVDRLSILDNMKVLIDDLINKTQALKTMPESSHIGHVTDQMRKLLKQLNDTIHECLDKTSTAQQMNNSRKAGDSYVERNDDRILLNVIIALLVVMIVLLSVLIMDRYIRKCSYCIARREYDIELLDNSSI